MDELTIKIHWKGVYSLDEVNKREDGNGLYLLAGKRKYKQEDSDIQYFGITEKKYKERFSDKNHPIHDITRDLKIWLGEVIYPQNFELKHLKTAEAIMIYYWQPNLNTQNKPYPPRPTTIVSHWFKKDGSPRINQVYKNLHDVMSWDGEYWRTGNLSVYQE
ncbi:MAG: hypothetical protein WCK96_11960 [Methylococcales bacterium]